MVYLTATVKLRHGKLQDFIALLNDIAPVLGKHGWKLLGSYATVAGRLNTVLDLWEMPEPNAVESAMRDPAFKQFRPRIAEIVEDETAAFLTKLPIG